MAAGPFPSSLLCAAALVLASAACSSMAADLSSEADVGATGSDTGFDPSDDSADGDTDTPSDHDDEGDTDKHACSLWQQDCPDGSKCTVVIDDQDQLVESRCTTVLDDAAVPGERCTSVGAGIDTCAAGSVCHYLDHAGEGVCVSLCIGSPSEPGCPDDGVGEEWGTECLASEASCPLPLCAARCHPFDRACDDGQVCVPKSNAFVCQQDREPKKFGEGRSCTDHSECGSGLACVSSSDAPCAEGTACCTRYCDIAEDEPCGEALVPGLDCMPWPGFGPDVPDEYATVGICGLF